MRGIPLASGRYDAGMNPRGGRGSRKIVMFLTVSSPSQIKVPRGARRLVAEVLAGGGDGAAGYNFSDQSGSGTYGGSGGKGGDYARGVATIPAGVRAIDIQVGGRGSSSSISFGNKRLASDQSLTAGFTRIERLRGGGGGNPGYDGSNSSGFPFSQPAQPGKDGEGGGKGGLAVQRSGGGGGAAGPFGGDGGTYGVGDYAGLPYGGGGSGGPSATAGYPGAFGAIRLTFT